MIQQAENILDTFLKEDFCNESDKTDILKHLTCGFALPRHCV